MKRTAYAILTSSESYCRSRGENEAAEILQRLAESTRGFKVAQKLLDHEMERLAARRKRESLLADAVQSSLPAGLKAHVSESSVSESYYVRVLDAAGNQLIECRVSGHIRPAGQHERECSSLEEAIRVIRQFLARMSN